MVRFAHSEAKSPGVLAPAIVRKVAWHFGVGAKTVRKYLLASQEKAAQEDVTPGKCTPRAPGGQQRKAGAGRKSAF
eukprot:119703-Lingulodinium_polyedra.AAC.1